MHRLIRVALINVALFSVMWGMNWMVAYMNRTQGWLHAAVSEVAAYGTLTGILGVMLAIVSLPVLLVVLVASGGMRHKG